MMGTSAVLYLPDYTREAFSTQVGRKPSIIHDIRGNDADLAYGGGHLRAGAIRHPACFDICTA